MVDFYGALLPPLLPLFAERMGLSMMLCGVVVSAASFASSFSQPVFGHLTDRSATVWALYASLAFAALASGFIGIAPGAAALAAAGIGVGLGSAAYHPLGSVIAGRLGRMRRALALACYSTAGSLGMSVAPVAAVPIVLYLGGAGLFTLAVPGIACAAAFLLATRARTFPLAGAPRRPGTFADAIPKGNVRAMVLLNAVVTLRYWTFYSLMVFLPHYFVAEGYGEMTGAWLLTGFLFGNTVGGMVGGAVADSVGRRAMIACSALAGAAVTYPFFVLGGWLSALALVAGSAAMGTGYPVMIAVAQELFPRSAGLASGLVMGFSWGLGALCAPVTGALADAFGLRAALTLTLLALPVSAALVFTLPAAGRSMPAAPGGS